MTLRSLPIVALVSWAALAGSPHAAAREVAVPVPDISQWALEMAPPGGEVRRMTLAEALREFRIPAVGLALIEDGRLAWTTTLGGAENTLFQAASLSKLVAAVAAMRLVQAGQLDLDRPVDAELRSWRIPDNEFTRGHPVTLRGLLSMTAGIGVPGYLGYVPGSPLPTLVDILAGRPPANSPPVTVIATPGTRYAYSGGGYEIVQALVEDATGRPFESVMRELVLEPAEMPDSTFAQPLPRELASRAATGHYADGSELPGGWRVIPELAAGGLWSTAGDLAKLLVEIGRAYRGEPSRLLDRQTAQAMLTRQNGGPYGLGAAVSGSGDALVMMKRGQNIGYQGFLILFPVRGQGMVVMTGSDNGSTLANALVRRAAALYGWPPLGPLED